MKCKRLTIQKILVSCANRALNHSSGSSECLVLHKLRLEQQQRFILSRQIKSLASGAVIQNSLSIISQTTNWRTCSQPSISSGQDALTVVHTEKAVPLIRAGGLPREWSRRRPRFKVKGCRQSRTEASPAATNTHWPCGPPFCSGGYRAHGSACSLNTEP